MHLRCPDDTPQFRQRKISPPSFKTELSHEAIPAQTPSAEISVSQNSGYAHNEAPQAAVLAHSFCVCPCGGLCWPEH